MNKNVVSTPIVFVEGATPHLGDVVYDVVTGVLGLASLFSTSLEGNTRFVVQPMMEEGDDSLPDSWVIDQHTLRVVTIGKVATTAPTFTKDLRGWRAQDVITRFKGIVTSMSYHLNGCVYATVVPKIRKKDRKKGLTEIPPSHSFPASQLVLLDSFYHVKAVEVNEKAPGGPSQRVPRSPAPRF